MVDGRLVVLFDRRVRVGAGVEQERRGLDLAGSGGHGKSAVGPPGDGQRRIQQPGMSSQNVPDTIDVTRRDALVEVACRLYFLVAEVLRHPGLVSGVHPIARRLSPGGSYFVSTLLWAGAYRKYYRGMPWAASKRWKLRLGHRKRFARYHRHRDSFGPIRGRKWRTGTSMT